jgi:hypothetical protein
MAKAYPASVKQKARDLRFQGMSLGEIGLELSVPKNTLSGWVKGLQLTGKQRKRIKQKEINSAAMGRKVAAKLLRNKMEAWKEGIRKKVKHFATVTHQSSEISKLICGIFYLCEGAKYPSTRGLIFSNSDPMVISCFLNLLRKFFNIKEAKLRCRIMYRWDQNCRKLERYWSRVTGIPLKQFFKTKPDARTRNKPTRKANYMGVCAIQYSDTTLQFTLQSIGEAIIEGRP